MDQAIDQTIGEIAKEQNMTTEQFLGHFALSTNVNLKVIHTIIKEYEKRISALESEIEELKRR